VFSVLIRQKQLKSVSTSNEIAFLRISISDATLIDGIVFYSEES